MNNLKVLYVGVAFPPKKDPECIQTGRVLKYLSQNNGVDLDILTAKPPVLYMPIDPSVRDHGVMFNNLYEKPLNENRYLNYLKNRLGVSPFPDFKHMFIDSIEKFCEREKVKKPDIIYTRSFPMSSSLAGLKLSQYFDIPLVVHLSDPWLLSPLHNYTISEKNRIEQSERQIFKRAKAITMTSELTIKRYRLHYPEFSKKFHLQPNVYDDSYVLDSVHRSARSKEKLSLVYTGGIIGNRNPKPILKAMQLLSKDYCGKVQLTLAGDADRPNRKLLNKININFVEYLGPVSFSKALELQSSADLLLLFDNYFERKEDALYMPSKLLDYGMHGKKILAITTPEGTTHNIIQESNLGYSFGHKEVDSITRLLEIAINEFSNNNYQFFRTEMLPIKYSASNNAKFVANLLKNNA